MSEHELWNELGNLYFISGAYDQAAYAYRRSIQLDGGFGWPYSNLALTYVQQGKYQEAIELYQRSLERLTDDKEKATSWNRLGNVHRHLKEYHKAVVAYQQADQLDPQGASDFLEGTQGHTDSGQMPVGSSGASIPEDSISGADTQTPADATEVGRTSILDDSTASWTPADPTQYQQDLSISPDPGSLTKWGDGDFDDDDLDMFPPLEQDADNYGPDGDDNDLGKWLLIPEQEPSREFETGAYVEEAAEVSLPTVSNTVEPQPANELEMTDVRTAGSETTAEKAVNYSPPGYEASAPVGCTPLLVAKSSASRMHQAGTYIDRNGDKLPKLETAQATDVDIEVEEKPLRDFVVTAGRRDDPPEVLPQRDKVLSDAVESTTEAESGDTVKAMDLERDDEEMQEIEADITKFKRVVQINPRNAHAWDALGTLYKSSENYKEAILAYQQALLCDSSKAIYYHHLGLVYACEGRDEDAIGAFRRVIEIDPDYSLAHATLGGYYRKMGLEELAQQHIGKAMKSIFDSENEYNRACLQAICGNADQAIELLGVALKNKQTYVDWILRDPDLDFIRQDPRFKQLISDYTR